MANDGEAINPAEDLERMYKEILGNRKDDISTQDRRIVHIESDQEEQADYSYFTTYGVDEKPLIAPLSS